MPILPIIVLEIFSIIAIVSSNVPLQNFKDRQYALNVFAQEELPPPDPTLNSPPAESPNDFTPAPSESTPAPDSSTPPSPSDSSTPAPDSSTPPPDTQSPPPGNSSQGIEPSLESSPTAAPSAQPNPMPEGNESIVLDQSQQETQQAAQTVLTSGDTVSGPAEQVNEKVQEKTTGQDQELENAKTPEEKATLSIDFAKDSIKEVEREIRKDDFSTTVFVIQRLSDQIDTASQNSQTSKSTQSLASFCNQAEVLLRSQQLTVPGEAEQDFEITRAKCFNLTQ